MNFLKLTHDELDPTAISKLIRDSSCGAISMFAGTTRDNFEDKEVTSLEYEAYESMAVKEMSKICDEIRARWNDVKHIAIYHRLGLVPVMEISVCIAISSPHRQTSMEVLPFAIDSLKKSVPIFKKEFYKDESNSSEWKKNPECKWSQGIN